MHCNILLIDGRLRRPLIDLPFNQTIYIIIALDVASVLNCQPRCRLINVWSIIVTTSSDSIFQNHLLSDNGHFQTSFDCQSTVLVPYSQKQIVGLYYRWKHTKGKKNTHEIHYIYKIEINYSLRHVGLIE